MADEQESDVDDIAVGTDPSDVVDAVDLMLVWVLVTMAVGVVMVVGDDDAIASTGIDAHRRCAGGTGTGTGRDTARDGVFATRDVVANG